MRSNPVSVATDLNVQIAGPDAAGKCPPSSIAVLPRTRLNIHALPASELPDQPPISKQQAQKDATVVRDSIQNLVSLLFTSSAFRLLLTDVFVTSRNVLADLVSSVGDAAQVVVSGANVVEGVVRPSEDEQKQVDDHKTNGDVAEQLPDTEEIRQKQAEIKVEVEKDILDTVNESKERGQEAWQKTMEESPDRIKETVIERIKAVSHLP